MKLKQILTTVLVALLSAAIAVGGTLAYLQSSDSDINVMVLGDVTIEQIEQERDENGALQDFTQNKPAIPAVYNDGLDANESWADNGVVIGGVEYKVFDETMKNVLDKFVTVKNTGKSPAYARTIVAIEAPNGDPNNLLHVNWNSTGVTQDSPNLVVEIDGVDYYIMVLTYNDVLEAGETSVPSFMQAFIDPAATREELAAYGDLWDIKVLSQAIQAEGFSGPEAALNAGFGAATAENVKAWLKDISTPTGAGGNGSFEPAPEGAVTVNGTDKAAVLSAIDAAKPGDVVALTDDTTIAGYNATDKLVIDKPITLDLNGKTLTTECGWGGIDLKGGASIVNGTINHTGNTAAIKAFQVGKIENVVINVTETANKTKGGIVVQEGAGCYVGSIKNVTINGATNGIETYRCGKRTDLAIGSMENVTINAIDTGISLSAPIGEVKNCTIKGAKNGVNAYLYGPYSVTADFINCVIEGADADIYAHDEVGKTNPGSMTVTYDSVMALGLNVVSEIEAEAAGRVFVGIK